MSPTTPQSHRSGKPPEPAGSVSPSAASRPDRSGASGTGHKPAALESAVAVAAMVTVLVITMANVLARYFTNKSFAWTEEISVFLLLVLTLAGSAVAASRDAHIRVSVLYDTGTSDRRRRLALLSSFAMTALFAAMSVLFGRLVHDEFVFEETSMSLGLPRWWYTASLTALCAAVAFRAATSGIRRSRIGPRRGAGPEAP